MTEFFCLEGDAIVIGNGLTVTILEIDGEDVVLQIDSSDDLPVAPGEAKLGAALAC